MRLRQTTTRRSQREAVRKALRTGLVALILSFQLSGCGSTEPETPTLPPSASSNLAGGNGTAASGGNDLPTVAPGPRGRIDGHVGLIGRPPGNPVIRMGVDPKCTALNRGRLVVQETVVANADGDLANVFVHLDGDFPRLAVPDEPVEIEQKDCVYHPRVVGVRLGQAIAIRNSDDLFHNVHASSGVGNSFNIGQARAGVVDEFQPQAAEIMVHLGCDLHRWMNAYVGVVDHPYFSVTGSDGAFQIDEVPAGTYTIRAWHEEYGEISDTLTVEADEVATVDLAYTADEED